MEKKEKPMDSEEAIWAEAKKQMERMTPEQRARYKDYADFMAGDGEYADNDDD
ncbi:MAG TPA: hypothetical protein PK875_14695 [Spirochaetota bacterium]|nr:hypothetical protein [Spirochaetota bacterium]OPZ38321.1 MAG: hypothetical protein BWY96_01145 [Spirochaetes bacterium ADurb.BinA120]HPI15155.1 hypothetical protein [Spirochaetota bacterium]HPO47033.1 hypothetical protein [Spirochaetota bacterium]HPV97874.1 hypothetical protein [Spirochaetota bacterium]